MINSTAISFAERIGNDPEETLITNVFYNIADFCNGIDGLRNDYSFYEWSAFVFVAIDKFLYNKKSNNRQTVMGALLHPFFDCFKSSAVQVNPTDFQQRMLFYSKNPLEIIPVLAKTFGGSPPTDYANPYSDINENIGIFDDFKIHSIVSKWMNDVMPKLIKIADYTDQHI